MVGPQYVSAPPGGGVMTAARRAAVANAAASLATVTKFAILAPENARKTNVLASLAKAENLAILSPENALPAPRISVKGSVARVENCVNLVSGCVLQIRVPMWFAETVEEKISKIILNYFKLNQIS